MTLIGNTTDEPDTGELMVGGYRLLASIGEGGMGVVHLAQGADGRRVALKVLRPQVIGDSDARDRLAREVATLQRVHSPHVAEILDAEPYADVPFVVTRYVPGLPLHRHVEEEGPMDEADLRWFAGILARAMGDCHAAGVLHRDIKPGNVLMEGRSPVLIDFGLAKVAEDSRLTQTGWLMGTPGYLAPEILYGDGPTPASDVHAWAATVVYAATGSAPYGKGPSMAVLDRVRRGEADLGGVPRSLVPILTAGLAAEPHRRPTLRQILAELDPWSPTGTSSRAADRSSSFGAVAGHQNDDRESTQVLPALPVTRVVDQHPRPALVSRPLAPRDDRAGNPQPGGTGTDCLDEPRAESGPSQRIHPARQRFGLVGLGAAVAGGLALAPWLTATAVAAVAVVLRFVSITAERHRLRQHYRGRARWFDVPVSILSSPGYLVLSLAGSVLLLGWAAATVAATAAVLMLLAPSLWLGMTIAAVVVVACLWWGPGSGRLRRTTRTCTRRWSGESTAGIYAGVLGLMLGGVLLATLITGEPIWAPAHDAPWTDGILGRLARMY